MYWIIIRKSINSVSMTSLSNSEPKKQNEATDALLSILRLAKDDLIRYDTVNTSYINIKSISILNQC